MVQLCRIVVAQWLNCGGEDWPDGVDAGALHPRLGQDIVAE